MILILLNQKLAWFHFKFLLYVLMIKNNKNPAFDHNKIFTISNHSFSSIWSIWIILIQ